MIGRRGFIGGLMSLPAVSLLPTACIEYQKFVVPPYEVSALGDLLFASADFPMAGKVAERLAEKLAK